MKRVKITESDGFVWHVLTETEAIRTFANGGSVFLLYDDDSEGEAQSIDAIKTHIRRGGYVGVEVGFIDDNENK